MWRPVDGIVVLLGAVLHRACTVKLVPTACMPAEHTRKSERDKIQPPAGVIGAGVVPAPLVGGGGASCRCGLPAMPMICLD